MTPRDPDIREIMSTFVSESLDILDRVEARLPALETGEDPEALDALFRAFHTLKGSAGFLNLSNIGRVSHTLESLLDHFRESAALPDGRAIDLIGNVTDTLRAFVHRAEEELSDAALDEEAGVLVGLISSLNASVSAAAEADAEAGTGAAEEGYGVFAGNSLVEIYLPEARSILSAIEEELSGAGEGAAGVLERITGQLRSAGDNAELVGLSSFAAAVHEVCDFAGSISLGEGLLTPQTLGYLRGRIAKLRELTEAIAAERAGHSEPSAGAGGTDEEAAAAARKIGEILVELGETSPDAVELALREQDDERKGKAARRAAAGRRDVRIETSKLDSLLDLTGELITAEAMVRGHAELAGVESSGLSRALSSLSKITRELQETAMSMRMIPLDGLFARMNRLVRELSRQEEKPLDFRMSGSETEMDRNIIEEIADPLMHIMRNAVDHGLEPPDERKAAGKPAEGRIELAAQYEGNEIWISVTDDGRGLEREKIRRKAVEAGLLKADSPPLPERELFGFIFQPGFSTKTEVSEISGRGVGMDVVKKNIEKLRGEIDVASTAGRGTRITLRIPLTLAVVSAAVLKVGHQLYAIPVFSSREFLKAEPEQVVHTGGRECVRIRDEVVPVIRLYEFFSVQGAQSRIDEGILIMVEGGGRKACLLADGIEGYRQTVIKSLTGYIGDPRGLSGCSIMGTGEICFILDAAGILAAELE